MLIVDGLAEAAGPGLEVATFLDKVKVDALYTTTLHKTGSFSAKNFAIQLLFTPVSSRSVAVRGWRGCEAAAR